MLIFISGGVRSGKSALGERLLAQFAGEGRKVYLATSEAYDEEMERRIAKHREDRSGKGFVTVERSRDIGSAAPLLMPSDAVLLDCLGTLAANEMFGAAYVPEAADTAEATAEKLLAGIMKLDEAVSVLIVISNELFSDGIDYNPMTAQYVALLGRLHCALAGKADIAIECASGCHIVHKGRI